MIKIKVIASGSTGNAYIVDDGKTRLLLEAGISIKKIKDGVNYKLSGVSGCLVSHEHGDHSKALKDVMKSGINCYMSAGTSSALNLSGHRLKTVKSMQQFKIGSWVIMPFDTVHDCAEPLCFLLQSGNEKLLFLTDTAYCKYRFSGITHLMIESNYHLEILKENVKNGSIPVPMKNRILNSHFSLENVVQFIKTLDLSVLKEIWLLHLSDGNSNEKQMKEAVQRVSGKQVYIAGQNGGFS